MVLIGFDIQPFTASIAFAAWVILISFNLNNTIVLDPNLEPADISSQYT